MGYEGTGVTGVSVTDPEVYGGMHGSHTGLRVCFGVSVTEGDEEGSINSGQ